MPETVGKVGVTMQDERIGAEDTSLGAIGRAATALPAAGTNRHWKGGRKRVWTVGDALLGMEDKLAVVGAEVQEAATECVAALVQDDDGKLESLVDPEARGLLMRLSAHLGAGSLEEAAERILSMTSRERASCNH